MPLHNRYSDIEEYHRAYEAGEIDFATAVGTTCRNCGREGGLRRIKSYQRTAIEVEPGIEGRVTRLLLSIVRYQCCFCLRTTSLLPIQLIPYHRYTVRAMAGCLDTAIMAKEKGLGFAGCVERHFPGEAGITGWLLSCWVLLAVTGLRRAHPWLLQGFSLGELRSAQDVSGFLAELGRYWAVLCPRGPPVGFGEVVQRYARQTGQFLCGTPSQARRGSGVC